MRLGGSRKPNVARLLRKRRLDGLRDALRYRELATDDDGVAWDVGVVVRVQAAEALSAFPADDVTADLAGALKDPEPAVRVAAIGSLRGLGSPAVIEPLVDCAIGIPDRHEEPAALALELLTDWRAEGAPEVLVARLLAPDAPPLDESHHQTLDRLLQADPRGPGARDAIADRAVSALRNPPGPTAAGTAEAILGRLGPAVADRVLGPLTDGAVSPGLVRAAGFLGDARIVEPVIAELGSDDPEMRRSAAGAAGALNHTRAVPALLTATQDDEQPVRDAASDALNRMGMAAVIAGLAEIVGREAGANALRHAGDTPAVEEGGDTQVLPAQLLTHTRDAVDSVAAQRPSPGERTEAPAAVTAPPPALPPRQPLIRRGGLVDRLLGRAR
ncbi:MAG: hypothetical protein QOE06_2831 [Thermoleophilaceae bacterium]|nr:hypothetical protein [Thermoleophilaceae bacterium]